MHSHMAPGYVMGAKDEITIVLAHFIVGSTLTTEEIKRGYERLRLVVEYESFYGEKFSL